MDNITVKIETKPATDLREFMDPMIVARRIGMPYFQKMADGNLMLRVISESTDTKVLLDLINQRRAYIPIHPITSEKS
jgi:hypothetical protein